MNAKVVLAASLVVLASARLPAQHLSHPDVAALALRAEQATTSERAKLRPAAIEILRLATQQRPADSTLVFVARLALAMAQPLTHPDSNPRLEEGRWRFSAVRLLRSAARKSARPAALVEQLERAAPYPHIWDDPDREIEIVRRAADSTAYALPSNVFRAWAGLEIERGDPRRVAQRLAALQPRDVSEAERVHWTAALGFAMGSDTIGATDYFAGASRIKSAGDVALYRGDLEWIASPAELASWDSLRIDGTTHVDWLTRFWTRHDLADGRLPGTRLVEQFARWRLALKEYRWDQDGSLSAGMFPPVDAAAEYGLGDISFPRDTQTARSYYDNRYFARSRILDDRGLLVMRHGRPDEVIATPGATSLTQETLRWSTDDGDRIISFSRAALFGSPTYRFGMLARNYPVGDLMSICRIDSRLCVLAANHGGGHDQNLANEVVRKFTKTRQVAEVTEGNPQRFTSALGASIQAYGLPGGNVLVVAAIPAARLASAGGDGYAARLRVVVGDSVAGEIAATLDTLRHWRTTTPVAAGAVLNAVTVVPAPPGVWRVSVVVSDSAGSAGSGLAFASVPVIPIDGTAPRLSDPILGRAGSGVEWKKPSGNVSLNPGNAWPTDDPAILAITAAGLRIGAEYLFSVEVWDGNAKASRARLAVASTLRADATTMLLQRTISFKELAPGEYRVVLRLKETGNGSESVRERRVTVRK